jgi:hypothetical protein
MVCGVAFDYNTLLKKLPVLTGIQRQNGAVLYWGDSLRMTLFLRFLG